MKVLFIDTTHSLLPELLQEAGFECVHLPYNTKLEYENVISDFSGIIIRSKFYIDNAFLEKATNLKFIGRVGSGMENIDVEAAKIRGIECFNSPEGNRDAVGEQAIGMILSLFNNLNRANAEVRNGIWQREKNRGIELRGKTIGIIGFGNVGSAFAEKLMGFGCNILAYDKYKTNYSPVYVKECDLQSIQRESDIISFHVPLTPATYYMANRSFFTNCKKGVYIINTSRGKVLNTTDLAQFMMEGHINGACLDVLEYEATSFEKLSSSNPEFQYLCDSDKVVLSPHIAGWTHESNIKLSTILAKKIIHRFASSTN